MKIHSRKKLVRCALLFGLSLLIAGCASHSQPLVTESPGFLLGLFHGFTILFSLIGSTFLDIRIYSYPNAGILYDVGYFIGASMFLGGGGAGVKGGRRKTDNN